MVSFMGSLALKCVTIAGAVVVTCAVARGLVRAARHASRGDREKAAEEALAAAVAPARLAADAVAGLVWEVTAPPRELAGAGRWEMPLPRGRGRPTSMHRPRSGPPALQERARRERQVRSPRGQPRRPHLAFFLAMPAS